MSDKQRTPGFRSLSTQKRLNVAWRLVVAFLAILYALLPVVWIFSASINPTNSIASTKIIPDNATLDWYRFMLDNPRFPFPLWVWNSIKVSGITSVLVVALSALAAYSFSRFRFRGRQSLLKGILLAQVFPNILAIVAIFLIIRQHGAEIQIFRLKGILVVVILVKIGKKVIHIIQFGDKIFFCSGCLIRHFLFQFGRLICLFGGNLFVSGLKFVVIFLVSPTIFFHIFFRRCCISLGCILIIAAE